MLSEFKAWRLASGYTYDKRQEQAWQAATRAERERCVSRSLAIVNAILLDLTDRRGLRQEWEQIETDIQMEIINAWKDAVVAAIRETQEERP